MFILRFLIPFWDSCFCSEILDRVLGFLIGFLDSWSSSCFDPAAWGIWTSCQWFMPRTFLTAHKFAFCTVDCRTSNLHMMRHCAKTPQALSSYCYPFLHCTSIGTAVWCAKEVFVFLQSSYETPFVLFEFIDFFDFFVLCIRLRSRYHFSLGIYFYFLVRFIICTLLNLTVTDQNGSREMWNANICRKQT